MLVPTVAVGTVPSAQYPVGTACADASINLTAVWQLWLEFFHFLFFSIFLVSQMDHF
jgi:hypothetical protein